MYMALTETPVPTATTTTGTGARVPSRPVGIGVGKGGRRNMGMMVMMMLLMLEVLLMVLWLLWRCRIRWLLGAGEELGVLVRQGMLSVVEMLTGPRTTHLHRGRGGNLRRRQYDLVPVRIAHALHVRAVGSIAARSTCATSSAGPVGHRIVRLVRTVRVTNAATERLALAGHRFERVYHAPDPGRHVRDAERTAEKVTLVAQGAQHQVGILRFDTVRTEVAELVGLGHRRTGNVCRLHAFREGQNISVPFFEEDGEVKKLERTQGD
uniref:Uncharacterized protein n=1 Tax=Anopheles atroparvus TaxID=41427 RepID=A0A182IKW7_ANOAO